MAKHVLNNSAENFDFLLIGLVSGENQYSIVSKVNQTLGIDLALSDNISYNLKPGSIFHFSLWIRPVFRNGSRGERPSDQRTA